MLKRHTNLHCAVLAVKQRKDRYIQCLPDIERNPKQSGGVHQAKKVKQQRILLLAHLSSLLSPFLFGNQLRFGHELILPPVARGQLKAASRSFALSFKKDLSRFESNFNLVVNLGG